MVGFGEGHHSAAVIAMLVGDQDGVDVPPAHTARLEPRLDIAPRQTTVNQQEGLTRIDQRRVPLATTSEGRDAH